jgi:predicted alpha-1,2-mannosidase
MPKSRDLIFNNGANGELGYRSLFSHENESAQAGFYQVFLQEENINVELTATPRVGFHHYDFASGDTAKLILDLRHRDKILDSKIEVVDSFTLQGFRYSSEWATDQRIHFYIQFSEPFKHLVFDEDSLVAGFNFGVQSFLNVKVALSAVDVQGAKKNMQSEIPHWDFEKTKNQVQNTWEKELGKINVYGRSDDQKTIFYTALYHSLLNPNIYIDVDGRYRGMDLEIHKDTIDNHYTIFSLWDTFRATHPLFTLIDQNRTNQFIRTLLRQYQQGGKLPIWELAANYTNCMIGYHAIPVIVDAYVKGIRDYDEQLALQAMVHSASLDSEGLEFYKEKGFIAASDEAESASKTLEYSYDDWCIAVMADSLNENQIAQEFYARAQYYKNIFDPSTGFLRAKINNSWFGPFKPEEVNFNYTEANAWQYSMFVPQDIDGHIELMGGKEKYSNHLDRLFNSDSQTSGREQVDITGLIGQYAHGNEPSHHMAYLYNYVGQPWKTQARVRQIMEEQYQNAPDGLSGNEDCGQMSSWFVLSAMGFYSVTPGLDYYTIGTPLFDHVNLKLENGKTFVIRAEKLSSYNKFIQSVKLNGKPYNSTFIKHTDIMFGGELVFEMGYKEKQWGLESQPPSSVVKNKLIPVPYFQAVSQTFTDSLLVSIGSAIDGEIRFTTDGTEPTQFSNLYSQEIIIFSNATIKAVLFVNDQASKIISSDFYQIDGKRSIEVQSQYANQYSAAGDKTLIDHLRGSGSYRTGRWQGYREDLKAVVNLGEVKEISSISMGFLQDIKSWIFYPPQLSFSVSNNGKDFKHVATVTNSFPDDEYGSFHQDYKAYFKKLEAQYIKVEATNYGLCPDWHLGAGGKTWLFSDEILVE